MYEQHIHKRQRICERESLYVYVLVRTRLTEHSAIAEFTIADNDSQ